MVILGGRVCSYERGPPAESQREKERDANTAAMYICEDSGDVGAIGCQAAWSQGSRGTQERVRSIKTEWRNQTVCDMDRERVCERERERERQREGQCVDMNEGSVVKAVLNEVQIRAFDESVPVYFVRLGS